MTSKLHALSIWPVFLEALPRYHSHRDRLSFRVQGEYFCYSAKTSEPPLIECQMRLPIELLDQIVDHLHGDAPTLRMCSLVDHAWLHSSWRHLFERLHIKIKENTNLKESLHFLTSPPDFCAYVRTLHLEGSANAPYIFATSQIHQLQISSTLGAFPELRTFILDGFRIASQELEQGANLHLQHDPLPRRDLHKLSTLR